MVQFRLIPIVSFLTITILGFGKFGYAKDKPAKPSLKVQGKTGSNSQWLNNNINDIPEVRGKEKPEPSKVPKSPKFNVTLITTNTRLGAVNVTTLENRTNGVFVGKDPPDNIYHSAVIVHEHVFEFIFDKGIDATDKTPYIKDNQPIWYDSTFETNKTNKEVKTWLISQLKVFNQGTYHVVTHNCFHFTKALTEFLGGKEPKKYSQQRNWLMENEEIGDIIQLALQIAYEWNNAGEDAAKA